MKLHGKLAATLVFIPSISNPAPSRSSGVSSAWLAALSYSLAAPIISPLPSPTIPTGASAHITAVSGLRRRRRRRPQLVRAAVSPPLPSPPSAEWVTAAAALLRVMTPPADERLWQASSDVIGRHLASPSVTWRNQTPCGETACQRVVLGSGRFGEIGWRGPFNLRGVEHISGMFMPSDSARGGGGVENYL